MNPKKAPSGCFFHLYAVRRKRYSTENWKTFRIFCCVLHLSGKKPGIRAV
ncbi:hypothetical protein FORC098_3089 [Salmonella enterica subsp. enterica serovar Typhimurium]|uniref:Uncharacterized protein n=1 Tax=Salmonella enterica subsp. enterica serovar Dublin str. UC16 TaxID=1192688 RepID=M7RQZ0_SALDU|nr:hypothetical protein A670_00526 [Salmonella enterica subsp. enterica serovar Dublin str. UC16]EPJ00112.1 hypothetical protein A677_02016 [Salmonella enterica subsp. enterica serovar Enteritidis str. 2010K-0267]EPJ10123.1 hypothetical protein A680_02783 [Salmonella enterica subsp. enterica serovar Enteritidis str. 2010K-0286]QDQ32964.1 hypothetical protein FORC098_3089 [Salmonella enterica subsp. enterica serovar Typhimurium]